MSPLLPDRVPHRYPWKVEEVSSSSDKQHQSSSSHPTVVQSSHPTVPPQSTALVWTDSEAASWLKEMGWKRTVRSKNPFTDFNKNTFDFSKMKIRVNKAGKMIPHGMLLWCAANGIT